MTPIIIWIKYDAKSGMCNVIGVKKLDIEEIYSKKM